MEQLIVLGTVLLNPGAGFARLLRRPRAALAVVVLIGCSLLAHGALSSRLDVDAMRRQTAVRLAAEAGNSGGEVSEEDIATQATRALNMRRIMGYGAITLATPVALFVAALLLWLLVGGWRLSAGVRTCYRVLAHAALPWAVRALLSVPVLLSYPSIDPAHAEGLFRTHLGEWLGPGPGPWFLLDPFWLWTGLLVGVAVRGLGRRRWHAALVGLVFWALFGLLARAVL